MKLEISGLIRKLFHRYRQDGLTGVINSARRRADHWVRPLLEPLYQRFKPDEIELELQSDNAVFDSKRASLVEYDFRNDFQDEKSIIGQFITDLRPGDVVYDIGANCGLYSCFSAQAVPSIQVVAFEPHPTVADQLYTNLQLNSADATVKRIALGDEDGTVVLEEKGPTGHRISDSSHINEDDGIAVEIRPGDALLDQDEPPSPNVLKIDVEGSEFAVLEGFENTLSEGTVHCIYCEVHANRLRDNGTSWEALKVRLKQHGFDVEKLENGGDRFHIRATRPERE